MKSKNKQYSGLSFIEKGILFSLIELSANNNLATMSVDGIQIEIGAKKAQEKRIVCELLKSHFGLLAHEQNVFATRSAASKKRRPNNPGNIYVYCITVKSRQSTPRLLTGYTVAEQDSCLLALKKRHGKGYISHWFRVSDMKEALAQIEALNLTVETLSKANNFAFKSVSNIKQIETPLTQATAPIKAVEIQASSVIEKDALTEVIKADANTSSLTNKDGAIVKFKTIDPSSGIAVTDKAVLKAVQLVMDLPPSVDGKESKPPKPPKEIKPKTKKEEPAYSEAFERFWAAYAATGCLRMVGKGDCFMRWERLGADAFIETILKQIQSFVDTKVFKADQAHYIYAPTVYVNQKKWEGWVQPKVVASKFGVKAVSNFSGKEDGLF